jgi:ribosome biogenesis GTPase
VGIVVRRAVVDGFQAGFLITISELTALMEKIAHRTKDVPVIPVSNQTESGYEQLMPLIEHGKTYCLLGSSGVGKSTLLNQLSGKEQMQTGEISATIQRGKHVTSHRELILLTNGGILIDNPGMREVGISDSSEGLESTFEEIVALAHACKYSDCTHLHEEGCAVLAAIEEGTISEDGYSNYLKMMKERAHFETSLEDKKKRDKSFGKLMKHVVKHRKENKY